MRAAGRCLLVLSVVAVFSSCEEDTGYEAQSNRGDVMFRVQPRGVEGGRFLVDVRVDTHSGDLSELDLSGRTTLTVDGEDYRPVEPVSLRGHHDRATLAFELAEPPTELEIVITNVRSMSDVRFRWSQ